MNIPQQKSKEVYEFKKQLKALEGFRGRGTELISVAVPECLRKHMGGIEKLRPLKRPQTT